MTVNIRAGRTAVAQPCGHVLDPATARQALAVFAVKLPAIDGAALITAERRRQRAEEGHTDQADAARSDPDLAWMAWALLDRALAEKLDEADPPLMWPGTRPWKPGKTPLRALTIAAALIAAEIDRRLARGERP